MAELVAAHYTSDVLPTGNGAGPSDSRVEPEPNATSDMPRTTMTTPFAAPASSGIFGIFRIFGDDLLNVFTRHADEILDHRIMVMQARVDHVAAK